MSIIIQFDAHIGHANVLRGLFLLLLIFSMQKKRINKKSSLWFFNICLPILFLIKISGFKSSLQDSQSSSIWVSENDTLQNNPQLNKANDNDRPATANSLKTSNYDSDEAYN